MSAFDAASFSLERPTLGVSLRGLVAKVPSSKRLVCAAFCNTETSALWVESGRPRDRVERLR